MFNFNLYNAVPLLIMAQMISSVMKFNAAPSDHRFAILFGIRYNFIIFTSLQGARDFKSFLTVWIFDTTFSRWRVKCYSSSLGIQFVDISMLLWMSNGIRKSSIEILKDHLESNTYNEHGL